MRQRISHNGYMENALMPLVYIQSNSTKRQNFITLTPFAVGLLDLSMDLNP